MTAPASAASSIAARLSRYGGDCYSYCMLAAGHLDLVVETELKPYDIAGLIPIVTGAGGVVTTGHGQVAQGGGRIIAAGDPRVHEAAMKLLNSQDADQSFSHLTNRELVRAVFSRSL